MSILDERLHLGRMRGMRVLFDFDSERAKVSAMTIAELIEHCKECAFTVKLRPACDAEWKNWYRLGIAKEEWHRRQWDMHSTS